MIVTIRVKTPVGHAKGTLNRIKGLLKFGSGAKLETWVNDEDSIMYIEAIGNSRQISRLITSVNMFRSLVQTVTSNQNLRKVIKKHPEFHGINSDDLEELDNMFKNGTEIEIVKRAELEEKTPENVTFWEKIKRIFKKTG